MRFLLFLVSRSDHSCFAFSPSTGFRHYRFPRFRPGGYLKFPFPSGWQWGSEDTEAVWRPEYTVTVEVKLDTLHMSGMVLYHRSPVTSARYLLAFEHGHFVYRYEAASRP
ncbi:unnamed protein product [Protopolystoma xenopodis]|uniref:Uncharacterized protein n=1 Tax=Protopolystoma xenopodis TaxID=117903 RepID=A0A3S5BP18_9PLAT|nr:unnamed protein product [Protopolystoma xenopodis]